MAQTKTPYGLVYNDDGSLCVTYRDDVVPFRGVRSFAVETATTNLVTNSPQQPPCIIWSTAAYTQTIVTSGNLSGWKKIHITNVGAHSQLMHFGTYTHPVNETRTYAIDAIVPDDFRLEVYDIYENVSPLSKISQYRYAKTWTNTTGANRDTGIFLRTSLPANTSGSWDVYVRNYQIEKKPFASSFVVGSRQTGRLVIPVEDLKFDIANDDWVISYWKYPVATRYDTQNSYNECSLGQPTSGYSKGYI